jgi:REP-associated tyrosine transposase
MPYVRNWLHCAWGTKGRVPFLHDGKKYQVITHIRQKAGIRGIYIDTLNGYSDHLHCLLLLREDQMLSKVMQVIKGESSYWINKNKLVRSGFEWADEYYAVSVSESHSDRVKDYIRNQEQHHRNKTWEEECEELLSMYGFSRCEG